MEILLSKEQLADEFVKLFPHHKTDYDKHKEDYSDLLGHVFFGDLIDLPLSSLLKANTDKESIQKYIGFIERMYSIGDDDVKNVVEVTILEYLGDDEDVLKNAFAYSSDSLIEVSKQVEESLGRRKIIISHRKGKTLTRW